MVFAKDRFTSSLSVAVARTLQSAFPGYEFDNMYVQLSGQLGLLNIMPDVKGAYTKAIQKNRQFGILFGYKFLKAA